MKTKALLKHPEHPGNLHVGLLKRMPSARLSIFRTVFAGLLSLCLVTLLRAQPAGALPAFPGAEGFGSDTVGGRGGRVIRVTNLNDSGEGSFRDAVLQSGPRIVVFDVSGTIRLKSGIGILGPKRSYLTVAGQTSPGGVQIRGPAPTIIDGDPGIYIGNGAHDVVIRYMRIRLGGPNTYNTGSGLGLHSPKPHGPTYNIIFDHNSVEWATDDAMYAFLGVDKVTFQWNLVGAGALAFLQDGVTTYVASAPSMGTSTFNSKMSVHHNLLVHGGGRNPKVSRAGVYDFRNNVVYNWHNNNGLEWGSAGPGDYSDNWSAFGNIVNNHYIAGPDSRTPYFTLANGGPIRVDGSAAENGGSKVYMQGNWGPHCPSGCADDWDNKPNNGDHYRFKLTTNFVTLATAAQFRASKPYPAAPVTTHPTGKLKAMLLPTVGASKPFRDAVHKKLVNDVLNLTGSVNDAGKGGPWPDLKTGAPPAQLDTDGDGMPDEWEKKQDLDPQDPADGPASARNGYTNVENYLNELAGDLVPANK